jgi:hypothetical protein
VTASSPLLTGRSGTPHPLADNGWPHTTPKPNWPWNCLVTARTVQGMAPYPGQARCLALGFWPECFRRLNVKGGRRSFPKETRSALDIEGKHVTIQGPSPDLSPAITFVPSVCSASPPSLLIRSSMCGRPGPFRSVRDLGRVPARCSCLFGIPEGRSPRWLPAWLPAARPVVTSVSASGLQGRC